MNRQSPDAWNFYPKCASCSIVFLLAMLTHSRVSFGPAGHGTRAILISPSSSSWRPLASDKMSSPAFCGPLQQSPELGMNAVYRTRLATDLESTCLARAVGVAMCRFCDDS